MAGGNQEWRGFGVHGFDGPRSLAYSLDNAGHRHAQQFEVCASLMNGQRYATDDPPADDGFHREYEKVIVSHAIYTEMEMAGQVDLGGWLGYKPDPLARTLEHEVGSLKITHNILLPVHEINGGAKFRRRIVLPAGLLQPGNVVYHFLEYKSLPNMEPRQRASILADRAAAAAAADENVENAGADNAAVNPGADNAAVNPGADNAAVNGLWDNILENYNSSSDEDYQPDEDERPSDHFIRVTFQGTLG